MTTNNYHLRLAALAILLPILLLGSLAIGHVSAHEGHKHSNAPVSAKKLKNPLTASAETIDAGKRLFDKHCASCHGADGKSKTEIAAAMKKKPTDLTAKEMRGITDGEIYWVVTNGVTKSGMPAFKTKANIQDRWKMTLYVKHLMGEHKHAEHGGKSADPQAGHAQANAAANNNSDADVRAALTQYTSAVERGDLDAIGKLWSNDESVTVIENGHANYGWADYRDNHLGPELREMKNVRYALSDIKVNTSGHLAWATFKYTIAADFRERHIEGGGMGTAVLRHGPNGWQIMHWHTSSPRRPPAASPEKKN